jgi:hypothetical protein
MFHEIYDTDRVLHRSLILNFIGRLVAFTTLVGNSSDIFLQFSQTLINNASYDINDSTVKVPVVHDSQGTGTNTKETHKHDKSKCHDVLRDQWRNVR